MAFIRALYGEYAFVMLVMVLGLLASMSLAWEYQQSAETEVRSDFTHAATDRIAILHEMLDDNKILLNSLTAFYRASEGVTRPEFSVYAKQALKDHPDVQAIEWAPRVARADRAGYMKQERAWLPSFSITEKDEDGKLVEAGARDEYFPLSFVEPFKTNEAMAGYDLMQDPDSGPAITAARDNRQPQASGLFTEWQKVEGEADVLFAAPVYKDHHARDARGDVTYEALEGFVVTVVSLPKMIEAALAPLLPAGVNIVLEDLSAAGDEEKLLYLRSTKTRHFTNEEILEDFKNGTPMAQTSTYEVGGRKWQATMMPGRGLYTIGPQPGTYALLLGGVFFTGLMVFYMLSRIREHERISLEVEDRTQEVAKAKKRIETILLSTHEGIMGIDGGGKITFTNPRATNLLGYSKRELVGQDHHSLVLHSQADGTPHAKDSSVINQVLLDGRVCSTSDNVFWKKDGKPMQVEYTASPVLEGDDVAGAVIIFHDITERKLFEQQLEHMARHDQMTGLANRALFADRIKKAMFSADQKQKKVGVAYFDLNDFKPVNDKLGHAAGDLLLKTFATRLKEAVGDKGIAARMGGDEFTLMAENLGSKDDCLKIIDVLLESLKEPVDIAGQPIRITASIGVAFYPDDATAPDALVSASDGAMYRAKQAKKTGGIKYAVFEAAQDAGHKRKDKEARA